jgi:hypothetical protein
MIMVLALYRIHLLAAWAGIPRGFGEAPVQDSTSIHLFTVPCTRNRRFTEKLWKFLFGLILIAPSPEILSTVSVKRQWNDNTGSSRV